MTTSTSDFQDSAFLAQASYVLFDKLGGYSTAEVRSSLIDEDTYNGTFTEDQADDFLKRWKVVTHQKNTSSGFSATLFQNLQTGSFVYAIRGTELNDDDILGADAGDIVRDGIAIDQIVDMYNDWKRITTDAGSTYDAASLRTLKTETLIYNLIRMGQYSPVLMPGYGTAEAFMTYLQSRNDIIIDEPFGLVRQIEFVDSGDIFKDQCALGAGVPLTGQEISIAGHSLGGHLAAAFTRLFSDADGYRVGDALLENGAGFATGQIGGLSGNAALNISHLFSKLYGANQFSPSQVLNLYGSAGNEFASMNRQLGLVQQGGYEEIFTERALGATLGHGKDQMSDSLAVYNLFFSLDKAIQTNDAPSIKSILGNLRKVFEAASAEKLGTFEALVNAFGRLFVTGYQSIDESLWGVRDSFYLKLASIWASPDFLDDKTIVSLVEKSADEIARLAQANNGVAYRYALQELNPFAVDNANYTEHNVNGKLNSYDTNSDSGLSRQWIRDRAAMLEALNIARANDEIDLNGIYRAPTGNVIYSAYDASGGRISIHPMGLFLGTNRFITFGDAEVNELFGSSLEDHLYGDGGADVLSGVDGNDWIEGGAGSDDISGGDGNDTLYGGADNDVVHGNDGVDYLHGGKGADELYGDLDADHLIGVDGNDLLVGGLGNDTLEGGGGFDTYRFISGDGVDTILDSDGLGGITINGNSIVSPSGGFHRIGDTWLGTSGGQYYSFSFEGAGGAGLDLVISGTFHGQIRIENFSNGELGIELSELPVDTGTVYPTSQLFYAGQHIDERAFGTAGNDHVIVAGDYGFFIGLGGNDLFGEIGSTGGDAHILGNSGNDVFIGSDAPGTDYGGDIFIGGGGQDTFLGGERNESMLGDAGGAFEDELYDYDDRFTIDNFIFLFNENEEFGNIGFFVYWPISQTIEDVEFHFEGGMAEAVGWILGVDENTDLSIHYNDYMHGGGGNDYLTGMAGSDELHGGEGDDVLYGDFQAFGGGYGNLDDPFGFRGWFGKYGNDYMDGGDGNDTLTDEIAGSDVFVGGNGNDELTNAERHPTQQNNIAVLADSLDGSEVFDNYLDGGSGNDVLYSSNFYFGSHDILIGGDGDDQIEATGPWTFFDIDGGEGDDEITIGLGNFVVNGGSGVDQYFVSSLAPLALPQSQYPNSPPYYLFAPDNVVISDREEAGENSDQLTLTVLASLDDITFSRRGDNLVIGTVGYKEFVTIDDWYLSNEYKIERFIINTAGLDFSTTTYDWGVATVEAHVIWFGTEGPDALWVDGSYEKVQGGEGDDYIYGGGESDRIYGEEGDDSIDGGDGDDTIEAGEGNDTLLGGGGNDVLRGGAGADSYEFGLHSGNDVISEVGGAGDGTDNVQIGTQLTASDIAVSRFGNSLILQILSSSETVTLSDWFAGNGVEEIRFGDGTIWDTQYLLSITPQNHAPSVENPIEDQAILPQDMFAFEVPADTFSDTDSWDSLT